MGEYLILPAPSANRVYAQSAAPLLAAELEILAARSESGPVLADIEPVRVAGVDYLRARSTAAAASETDAADVAAVVADLSARFALFERLDDDRLRPVELPFHDHFGDDLVSIPRYQGKTNEQFTRLLINVAAASSRRRPTDRSWTLLDPLCGRGTTLSTGLLMGFDVAGVETDVKAVEAYAAFLKTYLRRKRLKHSAALTPVRREGRSLGRRLDVSVASAEAGRRQQLTVFSGDARDSAALYGRRRFDLVVADAPYGVVHGATEEPSAKQIGQKSGKQGARQGGKRSRSPRDLITDAFGVWAGQLTRGGVVAVSWNTYGMRREELIELAVAAGLEPKDDGPYLRLGHRVDSAIHRDVFVAVRPETPPATGGDREGDPAEDEEGLDPERR